MRSTHSRTPSIVVLVALVLVAAIGAWLSSRPGRVPTMLPTAAPSLVAADVIDPANEGRLVTIKGVLEVDGAPVDAELGVASQAAMLLRNVEMYQWQEQCVADACGQSGTWSAQAVDSSKFREQAGRVNPPDLPFTNARFDARALRLGVFTVDADAVAGLATLERPVTVRELPPNLAAIFRDNAGTLYSGEDLAKPAIGDLRVSYRIVPAGATTLTAVQRGDHLVVTAAPAATKN